VKNKDLNQSQRQKLKEKKNKQINGLEDAISYILELEKRIEKLEKESVNNGKEKSGN
jgi:hypothetical protein